MGGPRSPVFSRAVPTTRHRSRTFGTLLLAILVLLASGCASATTSGQASAALSDGLQEARSAVETAALTVSLLDDGRLTAPIADTSLLDEIGVLEDASVALTTLVPPAELVTPRLEGMSAIGTATAAVVAARSWVTSESGVDAPATAAEVLTALENAIGELDDVLAGIES